jgi:hypothetical protein
MVVDVDVGEGVSQWLLIIVCAAANKALKIESLPASMISSFHRVNCYAQQSVFILLYELHG